MGFEHINLDEIRQEKGYGEIKEDDIPDGVWKDIFVEADKRLIAYLKAGNNVANETAWVTRAWRDRARNIAKKAGFQTKIIFLDIPTDVAKERLLQNRNVKTHYDTPDDEFENYIKDFEKPMPEEDVIVFKQTDDLEEWMKNNFISKLIFNNRSLFRLFIFSVGAGL